MPERYFKNMAIRSVLACAFKVLSRSSPDFREITPHLPDGCCLPILVGRQLAVSRYTALRRELLR